MLCFFHSFFVTFGDSIGRDNEVMLRFEIVTHSEEANVRGGFRWEELEALVRLR